MSQSLIQKSQMIYPRVCTLFSEFKIRCPLGCSGYVFTFAYCSLLTVHHPNELLKLVQYNSSFSIPGEWFEQPMHRLAFQHHWDSA